MVAEAEKYKAEDDANKHCVEAKNGLEKYCYSLQSSVLSGETKDKIPADDKKKLEYAIKETMQWLDSHPAADKEEYEEKRKSLEAAAMPIMQKMAGSSGMGAGMPGMSGASGPAPSSADPASGPTIEEID
ncbi:hypothetical protein ACA910_015596 [Epithemia clementina (nom. ined.)]